MRLFAPIILLTLIAAGYRRPEVGNTAAGSPSTRSRSAWPEPRGAGGHPPRAGGTVSLAPYDAAGLRTRRPERQQQVDQIQHVDGVVFQYSIERSCRFSIVMIQVSAAHGGAGSSDEAVGLEGRKLIVEADRTRISAPNVAPSGPMASGPSGCSPGIHGNARRTRVRGCALRRAPARRRRPAERVRGEGPGRTDRRC